MALTLRASAADDAFSPLRSFFTEHCTACHGEAETVEGDVNLLALDSRQKLASKPELLIQLIKVLEDRLMPPEDESPFDEATRAAIVKRLRTQLHATASELPYKVTPIRRMNRFQYNNAVVDLLELDRDIFQMNERLLRRYQDYFHPATGKMPNEVRVGSRPLSKDIDGRRPEGFRGVAAFPQDQRAEHGFDNRGDHLSLSPLLMESFLKLSQSIVESPDLNPRECRSWDRFFSPPGSPARPRDGTVEGEAMTIVKVQGGPPAPQDMQGFGNQWTGNQQMFWRCNGADEQLRLGFDVQRAGKGLKLALTTAPDYGIFKILLDGKELGEPIDLFGPKVDHRVIPFDDVPVAAGRHELTIVCTGKRPKSPRFFFGVDHFQVTGLPQPKPSAIPSPDEAVAQRVRLLLRRAFRRPPAPDTLKRFTDFAVQELKSGKSMEATMRTAVGAVLAMPEFLYLYEQRASMQSSDAATKRTEVDDFELASRLAQFLWSSIPDDELLDVAEAGKLSDRAVLGQQIDRMMDDDRASRFCDNFPSQWLQLDRLVTSIPDREKYPYFYYFGYRTSMHMMSEPLLLFETIYVENRSTMDLIAPDFTWQSDMLRANYEGHAKGAHEVQVQVFRRVPLKDPRRGGVITNAAVMTMTSSPKRTQPITRGAWVNSVIFNDPPEPPPADVPPLPEVDEERLAKLTIRQRLANHRQRADCAGCHNRIDPFGFALENFGPTGVWRDKYENDAKVDSSGKLFNRFAFSDPVEFKQLIVKDRRRFLRGFISHLLCYALARELGPADEPALDQIVEAASKDDRLRSILKGIATSEPFRSK